jgi:hypothetical protein
LDVGTGAATIGAERDRIKLLEARTTTTNPAKMKTGYYVALSYCWGNHPPFVTTPETLADRTGAGFDVADLPRTLRDAVLITRELGFQYLWVDALCILQGDSPAAVEDWERESATMESIYGRAVITIVAAWSPDCNGGILLPAARHNEHNEHPSAGGRDREFSRNPLNTRGWALQEWLLSSRLATFASRTISFHCSESLLSGHFEHFGHSAFRYRLPMDKAPGWIDWMKIVINYAPRNLSNPRDKLPALAGLARRFDRQAGFANGRYLAGLWEASLLEDLLWKRDEDWFPAFFHAPRASVSRREGCAPTWSWASIVGNIRYGRMQGASSFRAEIVACDMVLASADPYSMVSSGMLVIKGPLKTADRMCMDYRGVPQVFDGAYLVGNVFADIQNEAAISLSEQVPALHCLLMSTSDSAQSLVLVQKDETSNTYERIGLLVTMEVGAPWWADAESTIVNIV